MQLARTIEPELTAIAPARRWAAEHLEAAGVSGRTLEILVLLVSEVVTNAVTHALPPVTLRLDIAPGLARVEVRDCARDVPVIQRPGPSAEGGRGVGLVDLLATRWGTTQHGGTDALKSVWFELAL